jgi:hypothetical protein
MSNVDFAEKAPWPDCKWREVGCGSQRRLRRLKALQAAPLQVSNPREVFQQNPMLRCVPRETPKPETKQLVNRELIWLSRHDFSTSFQ